MGQFLTQSFALEELLEQWDLDEFSSETLPESLNLSKLCTMLWETVNETITAPIRLLSGLFLMILLAALLQSVTAKSLPKENHHSFLMLCTLAMVAVLTEPLFNCFSGVEQALSQGSEFMLLFVPVFAGIQAASGAVSGAVCYQTAIIAVADVLLQTMSQTLLPLCTMGFALAIVDAITPWVSIGGLLRFTRRAVSVGLGAMMTLFLGVLSLQSVLTDSAEATVSKTAKYLIANAVPVVGGAVSDAYATVCQSMSLLRSTTGIIGILALCGFFLPPLIQLVLYRLVVTFALAISQLFGTDSLTRLLSGTAEALSLALALLISFGTLFVVATGMGCR